MTRLDVRSPQMIGARFALAFILLCGLSACAAPRVAYEQLDWLASWRLSQYVDLNTKQEQLYDAEFGKLWRWHRDQELPAYAQDLRRVAELSARAVTADEVRTWAERAQAHSQRVVERALPGGCVLIASFSEAQRLSVLQRIDRGITEAQQKYIDPPEAERQKKSAQRLRRSLERWVGKLEPEQLAMAAEWNQSRLGRHAEWLAERRAWRSQFAELLTRRTEPEFCPALGALLLPTDSNAALTRRPGAQSWFEFLSGLSATLTAAQREHLRAAVLSLVADAEALRLP